MASFSLQGGWITLNRGCNMRCNHCYQQDTEFDPKRNASLDLIRQEILFFKEAGAKSVVLIGGEPTVYPYLLSVVKDLVASDIIPILVTNGRELAKPENVDSLVNAGLRNITVSIKADSEEGYREVTGTKNSMVRVISAIKNIQRHKHVALGTSVTIEEYFVRHLENYVKFLLTLGVPHINFDLGSPVLKASGVDVTKIPDPFTLADAVERVHSQVSQTDQSYSFYMTIPLCIIDKRVKDDLIAGKRISTSCHVGKGNAAIFSEDGDVLPCNHFTDVAYGKLGKDFSTAEEFSTFWNSEEARQFREEFNSYPHRNCITCPDWSICGGGCKIKWMYYDPKDYIGQPRPGKPAKPVRIFNISSKK